MPSSEAYALAEDFARQHGLSISEVFDLAVRNLVAAAPAVGDPSLSLQQLNEELQVRNEELAAQAEELAAQAEELAHQQDELAATNGTLERERRFFANILEHVPAGIGYADKDLVVRMVNTTFATNYQRRVEDFVGKTLRCAFPEEDFPGLAERAEQPLREVLRTRQPWHNVGYPVNMRDAEGRIQERFRDASVVPVLGEDGEVQGLLSLSFDSTSRVLAEREAQQTAQALAAQRQLTERILEHAPIAMAFVDADLVYRWHNPFHAELMAVEPGALVGLPVKGTLPANVYEHTERIYRQVLETRQPHHVSTLPTRMPGQPGVTYFDIDYVPVSDETGSADGILVIGTVVTDRVERERLQAETILALERADRYKDEFLGILSHELRTPLNFIMGFATILEDGVQGPLNDEQHRAVGKIVRGAEQMLRLVEDLLDLASLQAGTFKLACGTTTYAPLVEEVSSNLRLLAERKGLALRVELDGDHKLVVDRLRIVQVLTNLVTNAIKFTDAGEVVVRSRVRDGMLVTEVCDTGPGIDANDFSRLFQRFQQLDMSDTRRAGGTGLGLAITKALVEAHGGAVGIESEVGRGSTFWFSLPLTEPPRV